MDLNAADLLNNNEDRNKSLNGYDSSSTLTRWCVSVMHMVNMLVFSQPGVSWPTDLYYITRNATTVVLLYVHSGEVVVRI